MTAKLKEIYKGSFKNRKRFDDGGAVSYYDSMPSYSTQFGGSADTSPVTYTAPDSATTGANSIASQVGTNPTAGFSTSGTDQYNNGPSSGGGSLGAGALGKLLGLGGSGGGGSTGLAALQALAGLAGAYGNFKNNQANTPKFAPPPLFGGQAGTGAPTAGQSNGGYGPPGGYNYKNYQGANASTPGLGYAPRVQSAPNIPSYYTYGQQPQASFYTGSQPNVPGHAKGGLIRKYALGGALNAAAPNTFAAMGNPAAAATNPALAGGIPQGGQLSGTMSTTPAGPRDAQGVPYSLYNGGAGATPPAPLGHAPMMGAPNPAVMGGPLQAAPRMTGSMGMPPSPMQQSPTMMHHPMMDFRGRGRMMATGGSTTETTADLPSPGPVANAHTLGGESMSPLSQMFPQQRKWSGPSASPPGNHANGGHSAGQSPLSTVSRHVVGPGDGTSDDIPARLANGEFVVDAQTVSMLGNGSNDAGAKRLEEFRQGIRKHKGKALAKGAMAPDAKPMHKYLGGKS